MKKGWTTDKLGDVCETITRGVSPKYVDKGGVRVLNQKCIRDHKVDFGAARIHDIASKKVSDDKFIRVGDVLVNSTGEGTLGRVAQVRELPNEKVTVDSHVSIIRPLQGKFHIDFFGWALILIEEEIKMSGAGASGQTELARTVLQNKFTLTFPESLAEQKQIASTLDSAFAALAKSKANAERNLQNAKELFESYLEEVFVNLQVKWDAVPFEKVCQLIGGSQPSKDHFIHKPKEGYIRLIQVRDYKTDKYITFIPKDKAKRFCSKHDIMIGRYGPPIFGIFKGLEGAYNVALMKAVVNEQICIPDYFFWFLKTNALRKFVEKSSKRAAGQDGIRKELLDEYPVPVPQLSVQMNIVNEIQVFSDNARKLESIYEQKLNDLDELKKSILKKAFSGELKTIESFAS